MNALEIKPFTFFNIDNTPSYPKFKVSENAYQDVRDKFLVTFDFSSKSVYPMTIKEVCEKLECTEEELKTEIRSRGYECAK